MFLVVFPTIPKIYKFYLTPYIMILVIWKQSYGHFAEQLDFSDSKILWNLCW